MPSSPERPQLLIAAKLAAVVVLLGGLCLYLLARPAEVVVAAKNFTESRLLAEVIAQAIERHAGLAVDRRELGSTGLCWDALGSGAIDLYPDYSGTLLADVLRRAPISDPVRALAEVRQHLPMERGVEVLAPFGFNDTYVLAMRRDTAERLTIVRLSDLRAHPGLVAGFTSEFNQRADGWPGLAARYGLRFDRLPVDLAPGHLYQAARDGQVELISAFSTDARLRRFDLIPLADDLGFFPAYQAVPVVRRALLQRHPQLRPILEQLAGTIDDDTMMALNAEVDLDGRPVTQVAAGFLDRCDRLRQLPSLVP